MSLQNTTEPSQEVERLTAEQKRWEDKIKKLEDEKKELKEEKIVCERLFAFLKREDVSAKEISAQLPIWLEMKVGEIDYDDLDVAKSTIRDLVKKHYSEINSKIDKISDHLFSIDEERRSTVQLRLAQSDQEKRQETPQPLSMERLVAQHLAEWSAKPLPPKLPKFEISEGAAFKCYWRGDKTGVPGLPGSPSIPSLLLHDLENSKHQNTEAYKYIHRSQQTGPSALYGTSGAGKTRTIFEYLSHNFGYYLSAGANPRNNPGSEDVRSLIVNCTEKMPPLQPSQPLKSKASSEENFRLVQAMLKALLCVRREVFSQMDMALRKSRRQGLSCYEWLLIQLFPNEIVGCDIFLKIAHKIFRNDLQYSMDGLPPPEQEVHKFSCFLDEAQVLLESLDGRFLSSTGNGTTRSAYSAFLKGLCNLRLAGESTNINFPCFSGTGMSLEAYRDAANSVVVKPDLKKHSFYFVGLKTMSAADVVQYMKEFLDLSKVQRDLVQHAAAWLKGRPRWVATFIETYIDRKETTSTREPRGSFDCAERPLIKSLNRYIDVCTSKKDDGRRFSWSLHDKSAFAAVSKLFERNGREWMDVQETFRRATFEFSFSGKRQRVKKNAADMIEAGVAAVNVEVDNDASYVEASIGEPLVIQASITFFGLQDFISRKIASATSDSELGIAFEQFLLPSIQTRFQKILRSQLGPDSPLLSFITAEWTSYGVLAIRCETPSDTMGWFDAAVNARFDGAVAPFCMPDAYFGPDVAFLIRSKESWVNFRLVALQAKLKYQLNQDEALRTVVPELFYHTSRGVTPTLSLKDDLVIRWANIKSMLFGTENVGEITGGAILCSKEKAQRSKKRKRDIVRVMVQYPSEKTASAEPGPIAENAYNTNKKCKEKGGCKCCLHDHLVTIDVKNSVDLFGRDGVQLLKLVKPQSK